MMISFRDRVRECIAFLGGPLLALAAASIILMFLANEDPFARDALCRAARACFYSEAAGGWNKLAYDFSAGCLISIVFYWVLVRLPEHRKRQRIRKSFAAHYRSFKLACIENFLAVADGGFEAELPRQLLPLEQFRAYFKQQVGADKIRWDQVANNMNPYYLAATLDRMEVLRQEISFVMHNTDIENEEALEFLKRLSRAIVMQRNATTDYDSMKSFLGFFWSLFAGWDWVEGYSTRDIVQEMIEAI